MSLCGCYVMGAESFVDAVANVSTSGAGFQIGLETMLLNNPNGL
jgi:hypothetical protein